MSLTVVIPTHRRPDLLQRTLASVDAADRPADLERIIVLENGPQEGAREVCRRFETTLPLEYHHRPEPGKGRALQWVMERLQRGFVVLLDDDIRVSGSLLLDYSAAAQKFGSGHFFGGPMRVDYEPNGEPEEWLQHYLPGSAKGWSPSDPHVPVGPSDWFRGANLGVFVEDVLAVSGFTPDLGPGSHSAGTEGSPTGLDDELQARLLGAGCLPVYVEAAVVWHWVPRERCSEQWALHRQFRNCSSFAVRRTRHESRFKRTSRRVYQWSRCLAAATAVRLTSLTSNKRLRFAARYRLQHERGLLHGYGIAGTQRDSASAGGFPGIPTRSAPAPD